MLRNFFVSFLMVMFIMENETDNFFLWLGSKQEGTIPDELYSGLQRAFSTRKQRSTGQ